MDGIQFETAIGMLETGIYIGMGKGRREEK
jgi:hypothetical protein